MPLPMSLIALAIASFGIGTTEFIIMGLLPQVATDLRVSIPAAGLLIGGYALGVTFGGPVMAVLLSRFPRKTALLGLVVIFTIGNLLCGLAPNYALLMCARLLTALCHGTFFGVGAVVATTLVPASQRSRAVSIMFSGLTLANVLGVPAGTMLGQATSWRVAFLAIVPIGLIAIAAIWRWLPRQQGVEAQDLGRQFRVLCQPAVVLPMLASSLASASLFATFTYITPILQNVSGVSPHGVSLVLLLFGVVMTIGNLAGGRLADWRQIPSMLGGATASVVMLLVLGAAAASPAGATLAVAAWGLAFFTIASPLQMRVLEAAHEAPNLASTLNQSAFNFGNAIGAWLGAQALLAGASYGSLPYLSAGLGVGAVLVIAADALLSRRRAELVLA